MWLVAKGATTARDGEIVAPALADTLRIWYAGEGDHDDEESSLLLVRHARRNRMWLACDCRGDGPAPLLSPALLTEADTYYLRRLTGRNRAEHLLDCPFFRAQNFTNTDTKRAPARNPPEGYFAVLKPAPLALAQAPYDNVSMRDTANHGTPRLAKLMWRLLEMSGRTTIPAIDDVARDIASEFAAIRALAERIDVAPGISLARVLFTHPRDLATRRIFAVLRDLSKTWPNGHEPQAFLLVFARAVHEHSIESSDGMIDIATRVRHPGTRDAPIGGPHLALVAIGNHPDVRGYAAQRAWAQPVYNGHRFVPVDSDFDRAIVEALIAARRVFANDRIGLSATKPLFDYVTPEGGVRPAWTVTLAQGNQSVTAILDTDPANSSNRRRDALGCLGPVVDLDNQTLAQLPGNLQAAWDSRIIA